MAPGLTRARQGPRGGPGTCSLSLGGSGGSVCGWVCVGRGLEAFVKCQSGFYGMHKHILSYNLLHSSVFLYLK